MPSPNQRSPCFAGLSKGRGPQRPEGTVVVLMPEDVAVLPHPSVSTITWFDGEPPVEHLERRCEALVAANPWLCGQLWTGGAGVELLVPAAPGSIFGAVTDPELKPGLAYEALKARLLERGHLVLPGRQCKDAGEPLVKVRCIRTDPGFAVVLSMSHVVADGFTYYQLYRALGNASAPKLRVERVQGFGEALAGVLGEAQVKWKKCASLLAGLIAKLTVRKPFIPAFKLRAWYVNLEWVEQQKKLHDPASGVPFVSTNDVLTSWFLNRGAYDYGIMMANFRKRLCGLTDLHAGNYEGDLQLFPDMFKTPADVRRPLLNGFKTGRPDVPTAATNLSAHFACVTNWASFPSDLVFQGCSQRLHLPIFVSMGLLNACIIFRPRPGQLAVLLGERPEGDGGADDPCLGDRIF